MTRYIGNNARYTRTHGHMTRTLMKRWEVMEKDGKDGHKAFKNFKLITIKHTYMDTRNAAQ